MEQFPKDIWDLILKYKKDMELFEISPQPFTFDNTVMGCDFLYPLVTDWDCQTFLLNRLTELMLGDIGTTDLDYYLKMFVHVPLNMVEEYIQAKIIFRQRNGVWGIDGSDTPQDWYSTTASAIHDYVTTRDTQVFITRLLELSNSPLTKTLIITP
jgi:hypothetical protein